MLGSRQRELFSIQALQICDAFLVFVAFWLADKLRPILRPLFGMGEANELGLNEISWLLYIAVPFTPLVLEKFGFYQNILRKTVPELLSQMLRCFVVIGVAVAVMVVFFKMPPSSRLVLAVGFGLTAVLLLIRSLIVRQKLKNSAREGSGLKERVIITGTSLDIEKLLKAMPHTVTDYWEVVDKFNLDSQDFEELEGLLVDNSVQRVIIASGDTAFRQISRAVELCEKQGIEVWVSAGFIRTQVSRPMFDNLGGKPMLVLRTTPELSWALLFKSAMDRVGACIFILLTSPIWLFAMIGIRLASPGASVFFRQERAGKYGKSFKMWKFRTMVVDAEAKLAQVKEDMGNEMSGPVFKLENDPRVFPFARLLRKWSIDEFPQMLNVISGDMSLVGPRPLPVYEVAEFEKSEHRRRLSVKPGITCTWQAGGRNMITEWEDWVKMDLEYIDNWSLWLDMKLLIMTIPAVLFGRGAK